MGTGSSLRFVVEVQKDQADQALKAMTLAFNEAGIKARSALSGIGPASRGASSEISRFKENLSRSREAAMFFTHSLVEFGPAGRTAQIAISGLAGAMLGGGGIVLAMEAAQAAIRLFVQHQEDVEKRAKRVREALDAEVGSYLRLRDATLAVRLAGLAEGRESALEANAQKARQAWNETYDQLVKLRRQLEELQKSKAKWDEQSPVLGQIINVEQQLKELRAKELEDVKRINAEYDARLLEARNTLALHHAVGETAKIELAYRNAIVEAQFRLTHNLIDQQAYEIRINEALQTRKDLLEAIANRQEAARALNAGQSFADLEAPAFGPPQPATGRPQTATDLLRAGQPAGVGGFSPQEIADSYSQVEIDMAGIADQHLAASKAVTTYNEELRRSLDLSRQWGVTIGDAFAQFATGQATAKQFFAQFLQMAIKQVIANAYVTGSEAAKSQAGIPIVGPALAITAMGAMIQAILSQVANVPSAAKGWWDTGNYEGPMIIHPHERVLSAREAAESRRSGSGTGAGVVFNISAVDARGFDRTISNHNSAVAREVRRLRRRRML